MIYLIIDNDAYGNLPKLYAFGNKKDANKALRRMQKEKDDYGENHLELTLYEIKYSPKKGELIKNINYYSF